MSDFDKKFEQGLVNLNNQYAPGQYPVPPSQPMAKPKRQSTWMDIFTDSPRQTEPSEASPDYEEIRRKNGTNFGR